jgi:DNA-binding NtrC family response regulator
MPLPVEHHKEMGMANEKPTIIEGRFVPEHDGAAALVITASESERIFVTAALDGLLCNLHFAINRFEARAVLAAEPVAVMIVDGDARAFSWREWLEQISSTDTGPAPKLIVLSRFADDRMWAEALNLGAYDLLPRPLVADELAWVVRSALSERNGTHGSGWPADVKEHSAWNGC